MSEIPWQEQCDAARGIREEFGTAKALGYLIGEKLLSFLWASDRHPELQADLTGFVAEIQSIFKRREIDDYFATVRRVGPDGHILSEDEHGLMQEADAFEDDVVSAAQTAIRLERARALLLA